MASGMASICTGKSSDQYLSNANVKTDFATQQLGTPPGVIVALPAIYGDIARLAGINHKKISRKLFNYTMFRQNGIGSR